MLKIKNPGLVVLLRLRSRSKSEAQASHKDCKISKQEEKKPAGKEEEGHLTQQNQWVTESACMTKCNTTTWTLGAPLPGASSCSDLLPTVSLLNISQLYNYQTRDSVHFPFLFRDTKSWKSQQPPPELHTADAGNAGSLLQVGSLKNGRVLQLTQKETGGQFRESRLRGRGKAKVLLSFFVF